MYQLVHLSSVIYHIIVPHHDWLIVRARASKGQLAGVAPASGPLIVLKMRAVEESVEQIYVVSVSPSNLHVRDNRVLILTCMFNRFPPSGTERLEVLP
jgi:hypothetical protein